MDLAEPTETAELELKIFWWNVNLAPLGDEKHLETNELKEKAACLVEMLNFMKLDLLCLGEVGTGLLETLELMLKDTAYKVFNGVQTVTRVKFDSCVIYNSSKLAFEKSNPVVLTHIAANQKISHRIVYTIVETNEPLFLYVLHWPSRLRHEAETTYRNSLGINLRVSVNQIFETFGDGANIVALGDFNDEPYNASMSTWLLSSRDRRLVRERVESRYFYNPFWQFLAHPIKYSRSETELPRFGTFVYSSTEALTESHVFDQILFSSSFINKGPWHLNEDSVQIFSDDHADVGKFVRAVDSDHLPVYAEIKRFMG